MIRSMYSAISGLRNHQTMMDVVGNNISNVNTTGFKTSSVVFQDVLSQQLRGAGLATATEGGTNPSVIGLGSKVAAISTNFSQGSLQSTGRSTDFGIQGDGFFIVANSSGVAYTRSGSFAVDALGRLTTTDGAFVQGWQARPDGSIPVTQPIGSITIPVGDLVPPVQTSRMTVGGNLPSGAEAGMVYTTAATIYDGQGNPVSVRLEFTKLAEDPGAVPPVPANAWRVEARYVDSAGFLQPPSGGPGMPLSVGGAANDFIVFDANGKLDPSLHELQIDPAVLTGMGMPTIPGFPTQPITVDFNSESPLNQYGSIESVAILTQDGSAAGSLQSFSVSQEGLIVGTYSNGRTRVIGQFALAVFANPGGLATAGGTTYKESVNSGIPQIGTPGGGAGRGLIAAGMLEMSNTDLSQEFTNLIVAQRGFQANSRVITTSDELLQELVNLKR